MYKRQSSARLNTVAAAGSVFWVAVSQILSAPFLVKEWGVAGYGQWLILYTLPSYIAMSDFGIVPALTARMTKEYSLGNREMVDSTYQSIENLFGLAVGLIFLQVFLALMYGIYNIKNSSENNYFVINILIAYSVLSVYSRIQLSYPRSTGRYAESTIFYDFVQFLETPLMIAGAIISSDYVGAAMGLLIGRLIIMVSQSIMLKKIRVDCRIDKNLKKTFQLLKSILPTAVNSFSITAVQSIFSQGVILLSGVYLGPSMAAMLSTTRTITRMGVQFVGIRNRALMPHFASAYAAGDRNKLDKILKETYFLLVLTAIALPLFSIFFMNNILEMWLGEKLDVGLVFAIVVSLTSVLNAVWTSFGSIMNSIEASGRIGLSLFVILAVIVWPIIYMTKAYEMDGMAVSMLVFEMACLFVVKKYFNSIVKGMKNHDN